MKPAALPRVLIIAGSDSGGGAGLQADLRTCAAHGAFGTTAVTAVTAQNTLGVDAALALPPELVRAQIDAVLGDIGADAVKIGMLANAAIVRTVAEALAAAGLAGDRLPIVLDPVMVAKSGDSLLADDAVSALLRDLLPMASLVTPNLPELARLLDTDAAADEAARIGQARRLAARGPLVLAKGGHAAGEEIVDLLVDAAGVRGRFSHPRQAGRATHGTGCTLSTAVACRLARGDEATTAVRGAIEYLQGAIAAATPLGRGHGPVNHLWELSR